MSSDDEYDTDYYYPSDCSQCRLRKKNVNAVEEDENEETPVPKARKVWKKMDDATLKDIIASLSVDEDDIDWDLVAHELNKGSVGSHCNGAQCQRRWANKLNPSIKKEEWTKEEDRAILNLQEVWGNKWAKIAKELPPGRTNIDVRNRWLRLSKHKENMEEEVVKKTKPSRLNCVTRKPVVVSVEDVIDLVDNIGELSLKSAKKYAVVGNKTKTSSAPSITGSLAVDAGIAHDADDEVESKRGKDVITADGAVADSEFKDGALTELVVENDDGGGSLNREEPPKARKFAEAATDGATKNSTGGGETGVTRGGTMNRLVIACQLVQDAENMLHGGVIH